MIRHAEGTARPPWANVSRADGKRSLPSACLDVLFALALVFALAGACLPPQQAHASSTDVAISVDVAKAEPQPPAAHAVQVLVLDEAGLPVADARVTVAGGSETLNTNSSGKISVSGLEQGATYAVIVSKSGYVTSSGTFLCRGTENEVWPIVLKRNEVVPGQDDPRPAPSPSYPGSGGASNPYVTVDATAPRGSAPAQDGSSAAGEKAAGENAKSDKNASSDKRKPEASVSGDSQDESSSATSFQFPWWLLLLVLAALLVWLLFLLFKRRKEDDEPEGPEEAAQLPMDDDDADEGEPADEGEGELAGTDEVAVADEVAGIDDADDAAEVAVADSAPVADERDDDAGADERDVADSVPAAPDEPTSPVADEPVPAAFVPAPSALAAQRAARHRAARVSRNTDRTRHGGKSKGKGVGVRPRYGGRR